MTTMTGHWIITGANGYLGGELCKGLHRRGDRVIGLARAGRSLDLLKDTRISCHIYEDLPSIMSAGDIFVHCAGKVDTTGSWDEFVRINVDWTVSLFEQSARLGARCFIYVSSVAALGYRNRSRDAIIDETSCPDLVEGELYGRSKWLAEQALQERARSFSTRLVILRPGLIYGERPFASSQTWFNRGIIVDPNQRIPLVHIENFVGAVVSIASRPETEGVFFVVDDEQPTVSELNILKIRHGILRYHPWRIGRMGFWLLSATRRICSRRTVQKGHVAADYYFYTRRLRYSTEKLRTLVGWVPTINLNDSLDDCQGTLSPPCTEC